MIEQSSEVLAGVRLDDKAQELLDRSASLEAMIECVKWQADDIPIVQDALAGVQVLAAELYALAGDVHGGIVAMRPKPKAGIEPETQDAPCLNEEYLMLGDIRGYVKDVMTLIDSRLATLSAQPVA